MRKEASCLKLEVTEGGSKKGLLPQIVGNRSAGGYQHGQRREPCLSGSDPQPLSPPDWQANSRSWTNSAPCAGYQRKYDLRLLGTVPKQSRRRSGRQSQYRQPRLLEALRRIWLAPTRCASSDWSPRSRCGCLTTRRSTERLPRIRFRLLSASATCHGTLLTSQLPIRTEHWDITHPGFVEADTVAHGAIRLPVIVSGARRSPTATPAGPSAVRRGTTGRTAA